MYLNALILTSNFMEIPANLIINADDFGKNSNKNSAITKCFKIGIINSTSIMTNMAGFEEAISLSKENNFQDKIGLHANLTEGRPLTDLSETKLVDADGFFFKNNNKKFNYLSPKVKAKIKAEIIAQLNELYLKDISPTHLNSHHHVHTLPWLAPIFIQVCRQFNVKIRIAQTWNDNSNFLVPIYRNILNRIYKINRINFSERFETYLSYNKLKDQICNNNLTEIMVHPDINSNNHIYDSYETDNLKKIHLLLHAH
jgi:predicted glycoside hydrolase/deacetylase ChbG (UPF0249 family)